MKILREISGWFRVLFTPSCWIQNERFSSVWDEHLNCLAQSESFSQIDGYTARLGNEILWIANHPYASFTSRRLSGLRMRPKRITILRLMDRLERDSVLNSQADEYLNRLDSQLK